MFLCIDFVHVTNCFYNYDFMLQLQTCDVAFGAVLIAAFCDSDTLVFETLRVVLRIRCANTVSLFHKFQKGSRVSFTFS